jgi:hypothetical protein
METNILGWVTTRSFEALIRPSNDDIMERYQMNNNNNNNKTE